MILFICCRAWLRQAGMHAWTKVASVQIWWRVSRKLRFSRRYRAKPAEDLVASVWIAEIDSGSCCETVNHQGHEGTRSKCVTPKAFVALRVLGGSSLCGFASETDPLPGNP